MVRVDGLMTASAPWSNTVAGASQYYMRINFGSRAMRRVTISGALMSRLLVGPTDTVFRPTTPPGPRFAWVSDSIGQVPCPSVGLLLSAGPYRVAASLLGWYDNAAASAVGGPGSSTTTATTPPSDSAYLAFWR